MRALPKGIRTPEGMSFLPGRMGQTNEELLAEVQRLRTEIQQLREVVNALFNAVFEENEEEPEGVPHREDFNLYN